MISYLKLAQEVSKTKQPAITRIEDIDEIKAVKKLLKIYNDQGLCNVEVIPVLVLMPRQDLVLKEIQKLKGEVKDETDKLRAT
jgi:hypothetical protein